MIYYEAPLLEVLELTLENSFAQSGNYDFDMPNGLDGDSKWN